MRNTQDEGSVLTFIIVGVALFFGALGVALWYLFSFVPEQKRQEGIQQVEAARAKEVEKGDVTTPLGGDMSICTKKEGDDLVRYYDDGIRVRLAELTADQKRVSIWDGELLARFDANGSKKWFKVPDDAVKVFHTTIEGMKIDSTFECVKKPFNVNYFRRVDDPFVFEE